jgi:hypothetical protein
MVSELAANSMVAEDWWVVGRKLERDERKLKGAVMRS